jgi:hypothetical protein
LKTFSKLYKMKIQIKTEICKDMDCDNCPYLNHPDCLIRQGINIIEVEK